MICSQTDDSFAFIMRLSLLRSWNWVTGLVWLIVQFGKQQLDKTSNYCLMWRGQEHPDPWEMTYTSMDKPDLIHTVQTYSVWHHNYYVLLLVTWPSAGLLKHCTGAELKSVVLYAAHALTFRKDSRIMRSPELLSVAHGWIAISFVTSFTGV